MSEERPVTQVPTDEVEQVYGLLQVATEAVDSGDYRISIHTTIVEALVLVAGWLGETPE